MQLILPYVPKGRPWDKAWQRDRAVQCTDNYPRYLKGRVADMRDDNCDGA